MRPHTRPAAKHSREVWCPSRDTFRLWGAHCPPIRLMCRASSRTKCGSCSMPKCPSSASSLEFHQTRFPTNAALRESLLSERRPHRMRPSFLSRRESMSSQRQALKQADIAALSCAPQRNHLLERSRSCLKSRTPFQSPSSPPEASPMLAESSQPLLWGRREYKSALPFSPVKNPAPARFIAMPSSAATPTEQG